MFAYGAPKQGTMDSANSSSTRSSVSRTLVANSSRSTRIASPCLRPKRSDQDFGTCCGTLVAAVAMLVRYSFNDVSRKPWRSAGFTS